MPPSELAPDSPHDRADLLVIGGGVVGLSIALEASRIPWRVVVLERQSVGRGASWAGAGILPPGAKRPTADPIEQLRALGDRLFPEWCRRLEEATGIDPGYRRCGGLYLGRSRAERATLRANQPWWDELGIAYEPWARRELQARMPQLDLGLVHGAAASPNERESDSESLAWYLPDESQVRNPRLLQALAEACRRQGVVLVEDAPLERMAIEGDDRAIALTSRGRWSGRRACLTGGAWTPFFHELVPPAIYPVRGQMLLYRSAAPRFASIVNEGHRYLVPRDDGHLLVGSCEEEAGYELATTESAIADLRGWAESLVPDLTRDPLLRQWSGLRPATIDGLPYLGAVPSAAPLYLAAGHYRHGIHWSVATARLMVQLMQGQPTSIDLNPFRLVRGQTFSA